VGLFNRKYEYFFSAGNHPSYFKSPDLTAKSKPRSTPFVCGGCIGRERGRGENIIPNRYRGTLMYYVVWWEGKIVQKMLDENFGRNLASFIIRYRLNPEIQDNAISKAEMVIYS
jgi:hypothetical protein